MGLGKHLGTGLDLNANRARRQLLEERQNTTPLELATENQVAIRIDAMSLKHISRPTVVVLCMPWLLRIVGCPNSAHFDGALVPERGHPQHQERTWKGLGREARPRPVRMRRGLQQVGVTAVV